jgi:hemerythrin-like domain-containing protein
MANQAIEILMNEHKLILKGLDVAETMANRFETTGEINRDDLAKVVSFITDYADTFHHKKEEDVLFKWMAERGFPVDGGPVAVMLAEHDIGREFVQVFRDVLTRSNGNDRNAVTAVVDSLRGFAEHLRQHIFKEDNILYPMVVRMSGEENGADIVSRYREKISERESEEMNLKQAQTIAALEAVYAK